jgi:hypothetical protein
MSLRPASDDLFLADLPVLRDWVTADFCSACTALGVSPVVPGAAPCPDRGMPAGK